MMTRMALRRVAPFPVFHVIIIIFVLLLMRHDIMIFSSIVFKRGSRYIYKCHRDKMKI